ncbi:MAG: tetratricopeptide repeat protein [Prevotellaceae bacterium]|jgi:tetratricopeptide (TPR) repeat protein|nr:tetratricopeptide repeat protein [Prevotellaceae bacterium]
MYKLLKIIPLIFVFSGLKAQNDSLLQLRIASEQLTDSTDSQRFDYHFYQAENLKIHHEFNKAKNEYLECLLIDSTNAAAWFGLSKMYQFTSQYPDAFAALKKAVVYDKYNPYYREILAAYHIQYEDYNQAIKILERLSKENSGKVEYLYNLLDLYNFKKLNKKYLSTLNKIETQNGVSEEITMMKVEFYNLQHQHKKAIAEINKLISKSPLQISYQTLLGQYYFSIGDTLNGLATFNRILQKYPNNGYVLIQFFDYYNNTGDEQKAQECLHRVLTDKTIDISEQLQTFARYIDKLENNDKHKEANDFFTLLIENHPNESTIYSFYAVYQLGLKEIKKAEDNLQTAILLNPDNENNWKIIAEIQISNDSTEKLVKIADEAEKIFPKSTLWAYYKVFGLMQLEKGDSAMILIDNYVKSLDEAENNFKSIIISIKADYLWQQKKYPEAFECYEKSLEYNPSNFLTLNNYAYFLSECELTLNKAENMSSKTIRAEPQNATYLDTYAWILFKQKDYRLAKFYIEQALSYDESAELFDHYGDILFLLNETEKAVEQWKNAKVKGKDTDILNKKIEEKNYYSNKLSCE